LNAGNMRYRMLAGKYDMVVLCCIGLDGPRQLPQVSHAHCGTYDMLVKSAQALTAGAVSTTVIGPARCGGSSC
jgi:hypothetical protein